MTPMVIVAVFSLSAIAVAGLFMLRDREKPEGSEPEYPIDVTWPDPEAESEVPNPRDAKRRV
jgi:hypothetical protein